MFDGYLAVPVHFTVEFLGFLVASAGAILVVSRPGLISGPQSNRVAAAFGFGVLAAGQVAHGGSFLPRDGDEILAGIYALGLAALAVAVSSVVAPRTEGAKSAAVLGLPIKQPIALVPGVAALILAIVSLTASSRGGQKAFRRLALGALALTVCSVLVALSPDADFGTGTEKTYPYAAHAFKALGFLLVGAWLWTGIRSSIRIRFVGSFALLLVLVVLTLASALTGVITSNVEDDELARVGSQAQSINRTIRTATTTISDTTSSLANSSDFSAAVAGSRRSTIRDYVREATESTSVDLDVAMVLEPSGGLVASAGTGPAVEGKKGKPSDSPLARSLLLRIIGSDVVHDVIGPVQKQGASPEIIGRNTIAILAAAEVPAPNRQGPAGVLVTGRHIDALYLEELAAALRPANPSVIVRGRVVASELSPRVASKLSVPQSIENRIGFGGALEEEIDVGNRSFFSAFTALQTPNGKIVPGTVLVLSSPAQLVTGTREGITRTLFLVAMGAGAIVLALAWLSGRRITRPIQMLTQTAREVREGDLSARAAVAGEDEVGQLGETFNEMTAALSRTTEDLRDAATEEQRLRARIETIIQSMADGLVAVDADGKVLAFNPQLEKISGRRANKAVGLPVEEVVDVRDVHGNKVELEIFRLSEGTVSGVFLAKASGDMVPITVDSATLRGEDGVVAGGVAVIRDMTREREIERMKSEFLANISHELRTPLTPIKGYAEIMSQKELDSEKTRKFTAGILDSTAKLERVVELLVDFSAIEAGRLSPRAKPVDVGELVKDLAARLEERADRHEVVVDVRSRLPKVLGDERLLRRSLEEIGDNALKFSPDGGTIKLEVKGSSADGDGSGRAVAITISDEGIGIKGDDIARIFSDFQQLDGSETRSYGGLGLGLTFVQRIIAAHAGRVDVQSEPNVGTRLTITIPAAQKGRK
jgi:two-component system, OmpR family, phosphate regulon sensor histidine kinase PhoR